MQYLCYKLYSKSNEKNKSQFDQKEELTNRAL